MRMKHAGLALLAVAISVAVGWQTPSVAETSGARIEKLEERVRDLEARMAKVEAAVHDEMGMMKKGGMQDDGMGGAMGQPPGGGANSGGGMPSGGGMGGHM